jgi:signal transduction histidine kinase
LWAVFAIALIAWLVSLNYRDNAEENLAARLTANLYVIMGAVSRSADGRLIGRPDLRDSRFQSFQSGYYWSVGEIANPQNTSRSISLAGGDIVVPQGPVFDTSFQRQFATTDQWGNRLIGIEAQAFLGEGNELFAFRITGNQSEIDKQVGTFIRNLLIMLAIFALGFVLVTYFIVRLGLAPLRKASASLADIRDGKADRLEGRFPREIEPLIEETNSLITSNNLIIERARTQVGNLAHSLKTPLAVLRNEATGLKPQVKSVIEDQVSQMQSQIQSYLDRARISARSGTITSRTDAVHALERLVRVMAKLNPQLQIELKNLAGNAPIFAVERQDFEEMAGNLLENACKYAKKHIMVSLLSVPGNFLGLSIEDDGPGMSAADAQIAMGRGLRIDESIPGSGLGLSIVKDIAKEYQGTLKLTRSDLGGLNAKLVLPSRI